MFDTNRETPPPTPVAADAAIEQWDAVLRALYFEELCEQHNPLPN